MQLSASIRFLFSKKATLSLMGGVFLLWLPCSTPVSQAEPGNTHNFEVSQSFSPPLEDRIQTFVSANSSNDFANQGLLVAAVGLISLACVHGAYSYTHQNKQKRLEFLRNMTREFENDPEISQALKILDFEEYRSYQNHGNHGIVNEAATFKVTDDLLNYALADDESRQYQRTLLEKMSPDDENYQASLQRYYAETIIRSWFNKMLNSMEHFNHLIEAKVFTVQEVKPWLMYWVRLIADEKYRRNHDSRIYNRLYDYIHDHGFTGVRNLFEQFGYRILRNPYRQDDFSGVRDFHHYNKKLALSLAKASMLVYQDIQYVLETLEKWGIRDVQEDFQYFNNKEYDTQAFIFRTDACMVLAFRGSQEIRDWYTNFSMQLRKFTIRREGQTTISSYKGKVHTGFFLGWASIEKGVLAQIKHWQKQLQPGETLPPLLVTGHSLGGALATMAAASLQDNNMTVAGVYTFGQPRAGDLSFTRQLNTTLSGKVFRFINNNDVVPHVPPPFSFQNPTRFYAHLGTVKYFNSRGMLLENNKSISRAFDSFLGLIKALFESEFDLIADHNIAYYISHLAKTMERDSQNRVATKLENDINRLGGGPPVV